jgi:hypothetical protein
VASAYAAYFGSGRAFQSGDKQMKNTYRIFTSFEVKMLEKTEYFRSFAQDADITLTTRREASKDPKKSFRTLKP